MIAALAVDAALCRVRKDTFFQTRLADFFRNVFGLRKRFARGFVLDEFDAEEEAEATDITDMRMRLKRGKRESKNQEGTEEGVKIARTK